MPNKTRVAGKTKRLLADAQNSVFRGPQVEDHLRSGRIVAFRNRGTEYVSEYGMEWMSGGAGRRCD